MSGERQRAAAFFMVRPAHFGPNPQTAPSNAFQRPAGAADPVQASREFDAMLARLDAACAPAIVFDDTQRPAKPDAIFPNNWVTTHADGTVVLYPLEAPNRRPERRRDIVDALATSQRFTVSRIDDLAPLESRGQFLEGTGSLVLDRPNRLAYAARSSRTHQPAWERFGRRLGYTVTPFDTRDAAGRPIYHTNVMLSIGSDYALICAAVIRDPEQRQQVLRLLANSGRRLIEISYEQLRAFAGNILELEARDGSALIVLSQTAHNALEREQVAALEACGQLLPVAIDTIEAIGGGSVRCMIAEIFLPRAGG